MTGGPNEGDLRNICAKAVVFGDEVNTDDIIPSEHLQHIEVEYLATKAMSGLRMTFYEEVQALGGCILVAGKNFGTGSSREQAPDALKGANVKAVIAESFRALFFENACNVGLPVMAVPGILAQTRELDVLRVDIEGQTVVNETSGKTFRGEALPPVLLTTLQGGGLITMLRRYIVEQGMDKPYEVPPPVRRPDLNLPRPK